MKPKNGTHKELPQIAYGPEDNFTDVSELYSDELAHAEELVEGHAHDNDDLNPV